MLESLIYEEGILIYKERFRRRGGRPLIDDLTREAKYPQPAATVYSLVYCGILDFLFYLPTFAFFFFLL